VLELDEMRNGTILACQSLAKTDLTVRVTTLDDGQAVIPARTIAGEYTGMRELTRDIVEVTITLDDALTYYAGQYANLQVEGVGGSRSYSFANASVADGSTTLTFHIRVIPGGEMSAWFAKPNNIGRSIGVDGPYGVFRLRQAETPMLCIAGGSGMAPIKAMLEYGAAESITQPVVYLYGARTQADLYDVEITAALANAWAASFRFIPVL